MPPTTVVSYCFGEGRTCLAGGGRSGVANWRAKKKAFRLVPPAGLVDGSPWPSMMLNTASGDSTHTHRTRSAPAHLCSLYGVPPLWKTISSLALCVRFHSWPSMSQLGLHEVVLATGARHLAAPQRHRLLVGVPTLARGCVAAERVSLCAGRRRYARVPLGVAVHVVPATPRGPPSVAVCEHARTHMSAVVGCSRISGSWCIVGSATWPEILVENPALEVRCWRHHLWWRTCQALRGRCAWRHWKTNLPGGLEDWRRSRSSAAQERHSLRKGIDSGIPLQ